MKLLLWVGFIALLSACPRHIVDEDGGTGGDGQGGAGGGGCTCTGGGEAGGGGGGLGGGVGGGQGGGGGAPLPGLEIIVNQVDTTDGYTDLEFIDDNNPGTSVASVNCGTHCVINPLPSNHPVIFAHLGNHFAYSSWDATGFPHHDGWRWPLDLTGHPATRVVVTITGHNLIFRTTGLYPPAALGDGDGGVSVADEVCNQEAAQLDLPGHYLAWLSTSKLGAAERIPQGVRGWVSASYGAPPSSMMQAGAPWEPVFDQPTDAFIFWPPADEPLDVATGTTDWGTLAANCHDWTSNDPTDTYVKGVSNRGIPGFSNVGTSTCDQTARLYCLEIDHTAPLTTPIATASPAAFVTSGTYPSGGGLPAFDQACAAEAAQNQLPGTFKALVATEGANAASRVVTDPELLWWSYTTIDGGLIHAWTDEALNATADGKLLVPNDPARPANQRLLTGDTRVWTGAVDPASNASNSSCVGWLSNSGALNAMITRAEVRGWTQETASCNEQLHLFCLQTP